MDTPAGAAHSIQHAQGQFEENPAAGSRSEIMWQVHAAFRFGGYRTPKFDVTQALCVSLIVTVLGLIIQTSL
jgi:hypothetical protein